MSDKRAWELTGTLNAILRAPLVESSRDGVPVVAAASDLQFALGEIAAAFTADTGLRVRLSFGSTGTFARQIRQGARFEVFLADAESLVAGLHAGRLTRDAGVLHALGRIVILVPAGSVLPVDGALDGLSRPLAAWTVAVRLPLSILMGLAGRRARVERTWSRRR